MEANGGFLNVNSANLFIVGAAKCGTTALADVFRKSQHIGVPLVKEPHYFSVDIDPDSFSPSYRRDQLIAPKILPRRRHSAWIRDPQTYKELYRGLEQRYLLDASVSYLYSTEAAKRIYAHDPDSKIIIILRDPVDRAYSHYRMNLQRGYATRGFLEEVTKDHRAQVTGWGVTHLYVELGLYSEQLRRYVETFPHSSVCIVDWAWLRFRPHEAFDHIGRFIGIDGLQAATPSVVNSSPHVRWPRVNRELKAIYKRFGGPMMSAAAPMVKRILYTNKRRPSLSEAERNRVEELFAGEWATTLGDIRSFGRTGHVVGFDGSQLP